jgi:hypothetical protein
MNFTFKTERATGKYRSFSPDRHVIKLNRKEVGLIEDKKPYKIRLAVIKKDIMEDKNPNCPWKWITLKHESESLDDAKKFLKENYDRIMELFNIHYFD